LLDYAARQGAFVVEDDYDGEYRYDGPPIECLQGLDEDGRVLYVGSASKILFPALRLGWLVAPESLVPEFRRAKALADTGTAVLEQLVLAELIDEGHLERHLRRARTRNAARREALAAAIRRHFDGKAILAGTGAGLHGLVWIPSVPMRREAELRKRCAAQDVGIYPVKPFYRELPAVAGFVLGFSALDERAIAEGIRRMAGVVAAFR
jgi:GntR family transcriptional regulator/MocR family aminotransferase